MYWLVYHQTAVYLFIFYNNDTTDIYCVDDDDTRILNYMLLLCTQSLNTYKFIIIS